MEPLILTSPRTDVLTEKPRIASVDVMRGIVMVIMALDHARDYFHADAFVYDPTDLQQTTPLLFFTRFITHFCAPTFVLLAGTAARISQQRKTKKELSRFLFTRGLWLIILEVTVVRFGMLFQLYYDVVIFQVIWVIGFSMVLLAFTIRLPFNAILTLGLLITFGHDILHTFNVSGNDAFVILWTFAHQPSLIELAPGVSGLVMYPFLPWFGILLLGYCLGEWFTKGFDPELRRHLLLRVGALAILLFLVLRSFNLYGDPSPWAQQGSAAYTLLSFLNVTKYPLSLQYTLITLGPVLIGLALLNNVRVKSTHPLAVFGRVPLFYYVLHFYLLHLGALLLYLINTGKSISEIDFHFTAGFGGLPAGYGYSIIAAYIAWIAVVSILYPLCNAYNRYKSTHQNWWLSYL